MLSIQQLIYRIGDMEASDKNIIIQVIINMADNWVYTW